jgi:plasmid stabilization system protein ParE
MTCARLAELPRSGRACPERGWRLRQFPVAGYFVFFRPMVYGIEVVRFMSQRCDVEAEFALRRKPSRKPVPPKVRKRKTG